MRMRQPVLLGFSILALVGCATPQSRSLAPNATVGSAETAAGAAVTVQVLTPRFANKTGELPAFLVTVTNRGSSDVLLSPATVTARSGSNAVRVFTANELAARIRSEAAFQRQNVRARGDLQIQASEQDPRFVNSVPTILVRANALQDEAHVNWAEREQLARAGLLLQPTVVKPGQTGSGVVKLHPEDIASGVPLIVSVNAPGGAHDFAFTVSE